MLSKVTVPSNFMYVRNSNLLPFLLDEHGVKLTKYITSYYNTIQTKPINDIIQSCYKFTVYPVSLKQKTKSKLMSKGFQFRHLYCGIRRSTALCITHHHILDTCFSFLLSEFSCQQFCLRHTPSFSLLNEWSLLG